jgi:flagella basal body P-ring formation protein FlgA
MTPNEPGTPSDIGTVMMAGYIAGGLGFRFPLTIALLTAVILGAEPIAVAPITIDFRDSTLVNDTIFRVGDVARLTGGTTAIRERIGRVILGETAPAGFSRCMNTDDAVNLVRRTCTEASVAGVRDTKRILIRSLGREWRIADFADTINGYLQDSIQWPAGDYSIELDTTTPPWRCFDKPFTVSMSGLKTNHPRGAVRLELTVSQGSRIKRIPFIAAIHIATPVVVVKATIAMDSAIGPNTIALARRDITHFRFEPLYDTREVVGKAAARTIQTGLILHANLFKQQPVVLKGDCLDVSIKRGAVTVSVAARARASGAKGQRILVENIVSHRLIQVIIQDTGKAVLPHQEAL